MSDPVPAKQADLQTSKDRHVSHKEKGAVFQDTKEAMNDIDLEAGTPSYLENSDSEVIIAHELQQRSGFLRKLREGEEWLDSKIGIETRGVDRIHEEDKKPPSKANAFLMWWSVTCHVGTLPIGLLGPDVFGLSLHQSVAAIIAGTVLGSLCTASTSILGPKLGLRAIATSRYSFGFWGAKLCSFLNVIIGGGFAVVNVVVVGQILSAVSGYTMTISVGCVIIAIISYVVSLFGFSVIHTYEKYSWIMAVILLCVLIGEVSDKVDPSIPGKHGNSGLRFSGAFLSFFAVNFSAASGWCSMASDYYCNYPANTKQWKIATMTILGISIPTVFVTVIGACLANAAVSNSVANPVLNKAYNEHGLGGLLLESYHPTQFSKFCLVLLVFTAIGNNTAIFYSSGLALQLLGHHFHAVPRFIWSLINALVIGILAVAGKDHLSLIVSNFVSLLGYWTVSFTIILLIEDRWFRRHEGYNLNAWDVPSKLPWGVAAVLSLLTGYLAGGVTGMAQTWYIGPIAAKFGDFGGDVGVYLSLAFTLIVYPPARWYERKISGR